MWIQRIRHLERAGGLFTAGATLAVIFSEDLRMRLGAGWSHVLLGLLWAVASLCVWAYIGSPRDLRLALIPPLALLALFLGISAGLYPQKKEAFAKSSSPADSSHARAEITIGANSPTIRKSKPLNPITGADLKKQANVLANEIDEWCVRKNSTAPLLIITPEVPKYLIEQEQAHDLEFWNQAMNEFFETFRPKIASLRNKLKRCGISTDYVDSHMEPGPDFANLAVLRSFSWRIRVIVEGVPDSLICD